MGNASDSSRRRSIPQNNSAAVIASHNPAESAEASAEGGGPEDQLPQQPSQEMEMPNTTTTTTKREKGSHSRPSASRSNRNRNSMNRQLAMVSSPPRVTSKAETELECEQGNEDPLALPREEMTLKELFPDLNGSNLMEIERLNSGEDIDMDHHHAAGPSTSTSHQSNQHYNDQNRIHQEYLRNPLPIIPINFSKPVPVANFTLIPTLSTSNTNAKGPSSSKNNSPEKRPNYTKKLKPFALFVEATEDELRERVEYDMDEQDHHWLLLFNQRNKKLGQKECSFDNFEYIMDQLEKEWFDLVKDIPKGSARDYHNQYPDDVSCSVCDDGEAENSNAIVFCDGCNLAVHQDCYGVPFIPEGQWLCRKCMISPETPVSCVLCPTAGGAYKQTTTNKWAHLVCAMWIPECHISNTVFMEPIEGIESIQKSRYKLVCYICQKKYGAPIQCANKYCFVAFHPTCARKAKLYMRMRGQELTDTTHFKAFCDRHCPKEYRERIDVDRYLEIAQRELSAPAPKMILPAPVTTPLHQPSSSSSAKAGKSGGVSKKKKSSQQASTENYKFSLSAPIIPAIILRDLGAQTSVLMPKKRTDLIVAIAKYWSLKKESRRGAALLKRLHLEPWTSNASASKEEDEQKAQKYELLMAVRKDLERVRILLDMVRKREKQKGKLYKVLSSIFEYQASPLTAVLRVALEKCKSYDKYNIFSVPVSGKEVPDYYFHIKNPMDFSKMAEKLNNYEYTSVEDFQADIILICSNCLYYNKPETVFAKSALRLKTYFEELVSALKAKMAELGIDESNAWKEDSVLLSLIINT